MFFFSSLDRIFRSENDAACGTLGLEFELELGEAVVSEASLLAERRRASLALARKLRLRDFAILVGFRECVETKCTLALFECTFRTCSGTPT